MSQLIPTPLAIIFIAVFAWGIGLFLTKFNEKVTAELTQSSVDYQNMITDQSSQLRKNLSNRALTNVKK